MKLHLPNGLRKALLACLAALALPAALPTTLATASGIAVAWIMASQQTRAVDVTITSKDDYNGALGDDERNAAGNTWFFNIGGGDFNFGTNAIQEPTHEANFHLQQTLTVNNGFNNRTNTFNGNFTGDAGANLVFRAWGNGNVTNTWVFNGNLSEFAGDILTTAAGTLNIVFGAGAQTNTGAIRQEGGTLNLTINNGVTMHNSEIHVNNLTVNGDVDVNASVIVEGAATFGGRETVFTLGDGENVDLKGTTTFAAGASLTLQTDTTVQTEKQPKLTLHEIAGNTAGFSKIKLGHDVCLRIESGGVLKARELELVGGVAKIELGSDTISFDILNVIGDGKLIFDIKGLKLESGWSYKLFTGAKLDWTSLQSRISFTGYDDDNDDDDNGGNLRVDMNPDGTIELRSTKDAFVYDGAESLMWGEGGGGWVGEEEWDNTGRDVNFTATEGTHTVSLYSPHGENGGVEPIRVGVMDVAEGTAVYNIANRGEDAKAELRIGTLTVGDGVTMSLGEGVSLSVGSRFSLGKDAVLGISEDLDFTQRSILHGGGGSKITRAADAMNPVYVGVYLEGSTPDSFDEYLRDALGGITLENVGLSKRGSGTLTFTHNPDPNQGVGYTGGEDIIDVPLRIAEGAVQLDGNSFTVNKQVTGDGNLIIATASDDEEVMVHLVGGSNMTGLLEFSLWGARLGLGADSIVGGLKGEGNIVRARVITGEKENGNVKLTINVADGEEIKMRNVEVSGVDIVKRGEGTQWLAMHFSGGSITVESGVLSTSGLENDIPLQMSTLDATSLSISEGATFHWTDSARSGEDDQANAPGHVSGEVDIQGTFKIDDIIYLAQGATIGENGRIEAAWGHTIYLGNDLIIEHAGDALGGSATLKKGELEGAAERVHLQLTGGNQDYHIVGNGWGESANPIRVDSSIGLYWKANSGQLLVESSELDEVLVGGSGELIFQDQVTLRGELKYAEDYSGEGSVYVQNHEEQGLNLRAGGILKGVLNGVRGGEEGWGTFVDIGADFEVAGLQIKDGGSGNTGTSRFEISRYIDAPVDTVTLILNVMRDVTLDNTLTLGREEDPGIDLEKRGIKTQTITGDLKAWGGVTVSAGTLEVRGEGNETGEGSEIHGALRGSGTLKLGGGVTLTTLTLSGGGDFAGTLEMDGAAIVVVGDPATGKDLSIGTLSGRGGVTVSVGTLTLGTAEGATLTNLTLGQQATAGNLTVNTGNLTISETWTWTPGSELRLVTAGQTITLDGIWYITKPKSDEDGNVTGQLTIDLTEAFLGDTDGTGRVQLFASGFNEGWKDYFRFTVDGEDVDGKDYAGPYKGLSLNSKGVLTWGAKDVYWVVDQADEGLPWSGGTLFDIYDDGLGDQTKWTDDANVSFVVVDAGAAGTHNVTLREDVETGNLSIYAVGGGDTAETPLFIFNFDTPAPEEDSSPKEEHTLRVSGDLDVTHAELSFSKEVKLVVDGGVALKDGSTLTLRSDMVFSGSLTGEGSVKNGAESVVYALWDNGSTADTTWEAFSGRYNHVSRDSVGYGVDMSAKDLTITGSATPEGNFKVEGAGKTLTFSETLTPGEGAEVMVAEGATLALAGGVKGKGSITGTGVLKITGEEGETENPSEPPVFTGSIGVEEFIIEGGAQAFGAGAVVHGVKDDERGTITVTGGVLQLNEGANLSLAAVDLAPGNAEEAAELLHVVGNAAVSTLFGTGKVTVDEGATLTLSGAAGEKEVFTGQITGRASVAKTGTLRLGNGAVLSNLEVIGTVDVQEGSEATVQQLVDGSGTLADVSGTLAGAGALRLTAESGTFGGRVSSRFIYDGGGTFELSGAIDSPDVRVESGTLKVSGDVASVGDAIPSVTLAGGTLEAARKGLTINLALEGATSGLKVTNNLTVGEMEKGDGVLGTLEIAENATLTVQSGTLTINGILSWGSGATLSLGGDHENKLVFGTEAPFGRRDGKLTVSLQERYLRGMKKDEDSFLDLSVSKWKAEWVNEMEVTTDSERYKELKMNEDGTLTWTRYGVQWNGAAGKWSDDGAGGGWTEVDSNVPLDENTSVGDQDVYFIEGGETTVQVTIVDVEGTVEHGVHPKNVYVESGNFEFTGSGISTGGVLAVGGNPDPNAAARLTLSNVNISLPVIELQENGYLVLNDDGALTSPSEENGDAADTKIRFTGGTLEFGEALTDTDVSRHVAIAEDGSTEAAKVNVGTEKNVTWGSAETEVIGNGGLTLILNQTGIEKSGEGNFTLEWRETEAADKQQHSGNMEVHEGTLTLRAAAGTGENEGTVAFASVLRGDAQVTENGTLALQSADTAGLVYAGNITGVGTLNVSQGNVTLSGENTVADIVLTGGNATIGSDSALGDAGTTLTLVGGSVTGGTGSTVNAGTVSVTGASTVNGAVTFSGTVIGEGTLKAGTDAAVTLTGSLSRKDESTGEVTQRFLGTLDTGAGTITLSTSDTEVRASVAGNGTLEVKPAVDPSTGEPTDVTLSGTLGASDGNLTVKNGGEGDLLITSQNCGGGLNLSFNEPVEGDNPAAGGDVLAGDNPAAGGDAPEGSEPRIPRIVLGDAEHAVNVTELRSVSGAGDVVLSNVTLDMASDFSKGTARMFVDTAVPAQNASDVRAVDAAPAGGEVYLDGMDAANLDGITVNAHGLLSGVSGTYQVSTDKQLTLYFSADNMGSEAERGKLQGLINGNDDFNIEFSAGGAAGQGFNLEFDVSALVGALRAGGENSALYLRALQGGRWNAAEVGVTLDSQNELTDIVGARYEFTDDGLMIWGSTKDLYIVMDGDDSDPAVSRDPDVLGRRLATVVTAGQTLTLDWGKDGTVHNLLGGANATLNINDTSGTGLTVTLDNTYHEDIRDGRDQYTEAARGQDTTFAGTIVGGKGVDIVKTGLGTLTVNGNYTLEDGDTRLEAGALHLCGDNSMRSLTFAYGAPGTENRGLTLESGHTSIGSIAEATTTERNAVNLTKNAELTLTGGSTLARTSITGNGSGKLKLQDNASLVFTGGGITDTAVEMGNGAVLDFGATTDSRLTTLDGSGTLKNAEGGVVTVGGGKFSGTLGSSAEGGKAGGLVVADEASFTLDNAKSVSAVKMNVQVGKGASLTVDVSGKTGSASDTLVLGDISIGDGGSLTLDFGGKGVSRDFVRGNITSVGTDGSIVFHRDDELKSGVYYTGLAVKDETMKDYVQFTGFGNFLKDVTSDVQEGELILRVADARQNKFTEPLRHVAQGSEKNAQAGSVILWNALLAHPDVGTKPESDLAAVASTLVNSINAGNSAGLARTLAATAGAAISTLGPALAEDMHRQLTAIRNRTTTMANEVRDGADGQSPLRHAWINAESGYHELDSDGFAPGYKLTGWGGTVGADVDISRHLTAGLAFTAMYGDLDADAADSATGDMDTYYLSAFARVASGSWIHSFVLSGGVADVELNRTVNYGGLSPYRTNGSTDGYALGALYEVGYTGFVNRQGTAALQPIFNVEVRHVAIKGYSESGSDAGMDADDIDQTVLTFGAGARAQFAVGANIFNRAAVLETRALLKADVGDRSGSVNNAIVGSATRAEVESAEVGAVGVEAGVGISVPLGSNAGSVSLDGSLEFRDGWTSANATLGYRISF